jgi:DNA (cytosine-5)-methyltransferase 1
VQRRIKAADLFCGAGGTSTGLALACHHLGLGLDLLAVNHWELAIATHSANHKNARHLCTDLDSINPRDVVPSGHLNILVASPECTHFSNARGGKPVEDQKRAPAWLILRWLGALTVDNLLIENVPEFEGWGPLIQKRLPNPKYGKEEGATKYLYKLVPDPKRKGQIFLSFIEAIRAHGYNVEWRKLVAADYGDPTSRQRLFILARRGRRKVVWPEQTHAPAADLRQTAQNKLFEAPAIIRPHRTARDIIDFSIPSQSIFSRKRPLSHNTLRRIFAGLSKYCGLPFIVPQFGERDGQHPRTHPIDAPLPAVTSHGAGALCESFIVKFNNGQDAQSLDAPLDTVMTRDKHGLCQPFIVKLNNNADAEALDFPLTTVLAGGNHHGLCEPTAFVLGQQSGATLRNVDQPLPTIAGAGAISLIESQPFLIPQHNDRTRSIDRPLQTLTTESRGVGLVQPFIVACNHGHQDHRHHSLNKPMPVITAFDAWGFVEPFIVKFYGTGESQPLDEPLGTVTTKDRFGLVIPQLGVALDIRFRMLQPTELAAAHSFPRRYIFKGTRDKVVKQIGNSIPVEMSRALCTALIAA